MSGLHRLLTIFVITSVAPYSAIANQSAGIPGWVVSGSAAEKYRAAADGEVSHRGNASASLASITRADGFEFGTLMQWVDARPHIGKRMRFSAYVRASAVTTGAALWMRVDGNDGRVLEFDNMSNRGLIRGNMEWSRTDIILDIPPDSKLISFGVLLKGEGMIWIDSASLVEVFRHIATTGSPVSTPPMHTAPSYRPLLPENLDFEE